MSEPVSYEVKVGGRILKDGANFGDVLSGKNYFPTDFIRIQNPIHIEFEVSRTTFAGVHTLKLRIYGLREATRRYLFRDYVDALGFRPITLTVGGVLLFRGEMRECRSYKEGTHVVTEADCWDGGYSITSQKSSFYFSSDMDAFKMIENISRTAVGIRRIEAGASVNGSETLGTPQSKFQRRMVGSPLELARKFWAEGAYVENGTLFLVGQNELPRGSRVWAINAETGMIGTPRLSRTTIEVETVFNPRIRMCDIIDIQSTVQPQISGARVVCSMKHTFVSPYGAKAPSNKTHLGGYRNNDFKRYLTTSKDIYKDA